MPHVPNAPRGVRFFARVDRFHCECPNCGQLIVAGKDPTASPERLRHLRRRQTLYNPMSSTLYCPGCRKAFGVGLLLWPLGRAHGKTTPADQVPTRRQLRELAQYAQGIWPEDPKHPGDPLNLAIDSDCTCPPGGWKPHCPVHGWDTRQHALEEGGGPEDEEPDTEP